MAVIQLTDVVIPAEFTAYQVENSLVSTALSQNGVVANNALIAAQLWAGAANSTVRIWRDLPDTESDYFPFVDGYPQLLGLPECNGLDIVVPFRRFSPEVWRMKRESGDNPELPRSGIEVRTPFTTLDAEASGKSGK